MAATLNRPVAREHGLFLRSSEQMRIQGAESRVRATFRAVRNLGISPDRLMARARTMPVMRTPDSPGGRRRLSRRRLWLLSLTAVVLAIAGTTVALQSASARPG